MRSRSTRTVLRSSPAFRRVWLSQALSVVGDRCAIVALPFAVFHIGGSATDLGLVAAAQGVPFLLFSLLGGAWADRLPRARLMAASDLVRCAVQALAAVLLLTGHAEVWHLVVLMATFGAADAVFQPSMSGLLPELLRSSSDLQEANGLRSLANSVGMIAGPALGGLVVALVGAGGAFAFDAASFAVSSSLLVRLDGAQRRLDRAPERLVQQLMGGLREVRARRWVVAFLGLLAAYHLLTLPAVQVFGPLIAARKYEGATTWALALSSMGVGALVGNVVVMRAHPVERMRLAALAFCLAALQPLALFLAPPSLVLCLALGAGGALASIGFVLWETSLQTAVPGDAVSRVSSFDYMVSGGLLPLGLAVAGPLSALIGVQAVLLVQTAVFPLAVGLAASSVFRGASMMSRATGPACAGPVADARA